MVQVVLLENYKCWSKQVQPEESGDPNVCHSGILYEQAQQELCVAALLRDLTNPLVNRQALQ